jgi:phospholipid-translocating ATPase
MSTLPSPPSALNYESTGGIIMLLSLLLFENEFLHIVAISYTALVLNELIMVALEITTWHGWMILCEIGTAGVYFASMLVLPEYFGEFWRWRV